MPFRTVTVLIAVVTLVLSASAQDVRRILTKVSDTYANLKSYDFNIETRGLFESEGVKYQLTMPQEMAQGETPDEAMALHNNLPRIFKLGTDQRANPHVSFTTPNVHYYDFARIGQNLLYAKLLREEPLQVTGGPTPCYVIDIRRVADPNDSPDSLASAQTIWIDKRSNLVLRTAFRTKSRAAGAQPDLEIDWDVLFTSYSLNQAPPQWLTDAKITHDKQMRALTAKMVGTSPPDFQLSDLDGRRINSRNLHGKVVLLDFWATWCAPCRKELPIVASLEKTWRGKGLVILRITNEPSEDVRKFLKRTRQSFPTLVNGEKVSEQFSVPAIPTLVVLNAAGKIAAYDVATLTESELTVRLKKAGLD